MACYNIPQSTKIVCELLAHPVKGKQVIHACEILPLRTCAIARSTSSSPSSVAAAAAIEVPLVLLFINMRATATRPAWPRQSPPPPPPPPRLARLSYAPSARIRTRTHFPLLRLSLPTTAATAAAVRSRRGTRNTLPGFLLQKAPRPRGPCPPCLPARVGPTYGGQPVGCLPVQRFRPSASVRPAGRRPLGMSQGRSMAKHVCQIQTKLNGSANFTSQSFRQRATPTLFRSCPLHWLPIHPIWNAYGFILPLKKKL